MAGSKLAASESTEFVFQAMYPGTSQKVAYTNTSAQSTALGVGTTLIRVVSTTDCFIKIASNPTAVADTSLFLKAGIPEYFGVTGGYKVAAIRLTDNGSLYVTEGA
jgi:hypothetical protein